MYVESVSNYFLIVIPKSFPLNINEQNTTFKNSRIVEQIDNR